jgi:hypothetical protein
VSETARKASVQITLSCDCGTCRERADYAEYCGYTLYQIDGVSYADIPYFDGKYVTHSMLPEVFEGGWRGKPKPEYLRTEISFFGALSKNEFWEVFLYRLLPKRVRNYFWRNIVFMF